MDLIQDLVGKLGISEEQAKGGVGEIFNLAKEKLSDGDFSILANKIPGLDSIIGKKEEKEEKGGGLFGSVVDMLDGDDDKEEKSGGLFGSVVDMLDGDDDKEEKDGGLMGSLTGMLSSDAASGVLDSLGLDKLSSVAKLSGGFSKLGLDTEMITKFLPIVMNFAKTKGGSVVTDLLAKVLK